MLNYLTKYNIYFNKSFTNKVSQKNNKITLEAQLAKLFSTARWTNEEEKICCSLARQVEISKNFFTTYNLDWKKKKDAKPASSRLSSLAALILYISFVL